MYIYIYIYIYIERERERSRSIHVYIYIYMYSPSVQYNQNGNLCSCLNPPFPTPPFDSSRLLISGVEFLAPEGISLGPGRCPTYNSGNSNRESGQILK